MESVCGQEEMCLLRKPNNHLDAIFLQIIGWVPEVYDNIDELPADMPEDLKEYIRIRTHNNGGKTPKFVWMSCRGKNPADEKYIGEIVYKPWQGFPAYYFPYMNTPGYLPPIVVVRFVAPTFNVVIQVECKVYAKNIKHKRQEGLGLLIYQKL
ncbi:unnamed protein product, partial [Meganyctiphanes norvegica]